MVRCKAGGKNPKVEVIVDKESVGVKTINNIMTDYTFELPVAISGDVVVKISQNSAKKAIYIGGVIINGN